MRNRKRTVDLAVEGVVIVVSILLAFALDAWWESRGQRQEEAQVLENLSSEFQAAGIQLDRYLMMHQVILSSLEKTLAAVQEAHDRGDSRVEILTIDLSRILIGPTFDPRTGILDGLLASGGLGILQSESLRRTLSGWPGLLAEASEEESRSVHLILEHIDPALRDGTDLSRARFLSIEITEEACNNMLWGRSCGDIDLEVALPAKWNGTMSLPADLGTLGLLSTRLHILKHGIDQLETVREEIEVILALVEESRGSTPRTGDRLP
ncbi:MAG: DUF6090 family protein [Gemmatimonadota bacterium]|jgi:hypothetical protein